MAFIYFCVICAISTILSEVASDSWMTCQVFNPYGVSDCTDPTGVKYFMSGAGMDHYNLDTLQQFCSTGSGAGVSQCIRQLYGRCTLPGPQKLGLDVITDMVERGLQSVCDVGINDIMAGRECIASKMDAINHCADSTNAAAMAEFREDALLEEILSENISPSHYCPISENSEYLKELCIKRADDLENRITCDPDQEKAEPIREWFRDEFTDTQNEPIIS